MKFLIIILTSLSISFQYNEWVITPTGLGPIQIDEPLNKVKKSLEPAFDIKSNAKGGFDVYEDNDLLVSVWSKNQDNNIGFIKILSSKYSTRDNLKVNQKISEIEQIRTDFFLELDEVTNEFYFMPLELQSKDSNNWKILNLLYFKSTLNNDSLKFEFNEETQSFRSINYDKNALLDYFLIYKWK